MFYTGIGARATPPGIMLTMTGIARMLDIKGYTLRSGGAENADESFEKGTHLVTPEIYLPWKGFRNNKSPRHEPIPAAYRIAAKYHPRWDSLRPSVHRLMARNVHQILGDDLNTLSHFVICWTGDGKASGGTGQAMRIAKACNVPIYNLYNDVDVKSLRDNVLNG